MIAGRKQAATAGRPRLLRDIVCPFCSLLCDDLAVDVSGPRARLQGTKCAVADRGFHHHSSIVTSRISGKQVTLDMALERAARLLGAATQPLIAGLGTDTNGCRAALALAEQCGAVVDHMHSEAAMANLLTLQSRGWVTTTLTEIKNRADFVLLVGTDGDSVCPRFSERILAGRPGLSAKANSRRHVAGLGLPAKGPGSGTRGKKLSQQVPCSPAELPAMLSALRACLRGENDGPANRRFPVSRARELKAMAQRMKTCSYGVVVWAPATLPEACADLVVDSLCEMVSALNEKTRFAGLSLGGNEAGATFQNVCSWQAGYPSRVRFSVDGPHYDPVLYSSRSMVESGTADVLLWISSISPVLKPPPFRGPVIVLSRPMARPPANADVFIPVSTPGLDHAGTMFRTDGVVGLPLKRVRESSLPSVADILSRIGKSL